MSFHSGEKFQRALESGLADWEKSLQELPKKDRDSVRKHLSKLRQQVKLVPQGGYALMIGGGAAMAVEREYRLNHARQFGPFGCGSEEEENKLRKQQEQDKETARKMITGG